MHLDALSARQSQLCAWITIILQQWLVFNGIRRCTRADHPLGASSIILIYHPRALAHAGKKTIKVTFVKPGGEKVTVDAKIGDSMLEVAHANKIDVEGACGGETACSTCHIILKPDVYAKLPPASEAEEDMLDLASGLTKTSRLGCQVRSLNARLQHFFLWGTDDGNFGIL